MSENKAHQLLDPADKQNVPKAVALLQAICDLRRFPLDGLHPSDQADLHRFHFLGEVFSSFLSPFIDVTFTLEQQIVSLVKYAHLICACWIRHGSSFMTGALYADTQAIVKNIIFSLAKQQVLDSTKNFHIILDGTDRLEQVFSDARTQDHSRNFDLLQLSQKLATASTINNIFLRNPDLDRGHARLSLTAATGVDHVNPKSCLGNLASGSVNIQALWVAGQNNANKVLKDYFGDEAAVDFTKLFQDPKVDLLRPDGNYVGASVADSHAEYEDHDINTLHDNTILDPTLQTQNDGNNDNIGENDNIGDDNNIGDNGDDIGNNIGDNGDNSNGDNSNDDNENSDNEENNGTTPNMVAHAANVDLEYFLPSSPGYATQPPPPTLFIDGPDGKQYYKGSVVASYLRGGHCAKKVVERTLRARGVTLESLRETRDPNVMDILSGEDSVIVGDLAASLVRLGQRVCLVVIQIIGFVHKKSRIDRVAMEMLEQRGGDLVVTGEILEILPLRCGDNTGNSSWAWSFNYLTSSGKTKSSRSKLTVKQSSFSFPAWLTIPLCPILRDSSLVHDNPTQPFTWAFEEEILNESLSQLWGLLKEQFPENVHDALKILASTSIDELPYRENDGSYLTLFVHLLILTSISQNTNTSLLMTW